MSLPYLHNPALFPLFEDLPLMEEMDSTYYMETPQGMLQPARTWCFVGEIVHDALSHMPVLGHRVEVRDMSGATHSIMFYPTAGGLDFGQLKMGNTIFVRYATRCFFSDLATEAIKVEDLNFVKVIPLNLDSLVYMSQLFFEQGPVCCNCQRDISMQGGAAPRCNSCLTAKYCSQACKEMNMPVHTSFCSICQDLQEVFGVDFDRFIQYVPFR